MVKKWGENVYIRTRKSLEKIFRYMWYGIWIHGWEIPRLAPLPTYLWSWSHVSYIFPPIYRNTISRYLPTRARGAHPREEPETNQFTLSTKLVEKDCSYIEALKSIKCKERQWLPTIRRIGKEILFQWEYIVNSSPSVIAGEINESKVVDVGGLRVKVAGQYFDHPFTAAWLRKVCQWLGRNGSRWLTRIQEIFALSYLLKTGLRDVFANTRLRNK